MESFGSIEINTWKGEIKMGQTFQTIVNIMAVVGFLACLPVLALILWLLKVKIVETFVRCPKCKKRGVSMKEALTTHWICLHCGYER